MSLIGHSLGGHTAMLVVARRPDLVAGLALIEAGCEADPDAPARMSAMLDAWPVPFPDCRAAVDYFGGGLAGRVWAGGLAARPRSTGLWPWFDREVMEACLREIAERSCCGEWQRVSCARLVVRGEDGDLASGETDRLAALAPGTRLVTLGAAGHDVHLDRSRAVTRLLEGWLRAVEAPAAGPRWIPGPAPHPRGSTLVCGAGPTLVRGAGAAWPPKPYDARET